MTKLRRLGRVWCVWRKKGSHEETRKHSELMHVFPLHTGMYDVKSLNMQTMRNRGLKGKQREGK